MKIFMLATLINISSNWSLLKIGTSYIFTTYRHSAQPMTLIANIFSPLGHKTCQFSLSSPNSVWILASWTLLFPPRSCDIILKVANVDLPPWLLAFGQMMGFCNLKPNQSPKKFSWIMYNNHCIIPSHMAPHNLSLTHCHMHVFQLPQFFSEMMMEPG